jgi:molecular chaperone HtpG
MTAEELVSNLGVIAHSGARDFVQALRQGGQEVTNLIGQFGVGFYSVFMVAEWVRVTSRSFRKDAPAAAWYCEGGETYTVEPAEKAERGTEVLIKLKEDALDFVQDYRLREIVRKHSDFVPFPIFIHSVQKAGEDDKPASEETQANRQTALWRQNPRQVEAKDYDEFYHQLTLEPEPPLTHAHMSVDAPVQMYALLFIPASPERGMFSLRKEEGLKLYARKVLIQEYNRDLLPEYLGFVQGVVDSEDLPLNVSRESIQSTRIMANLKKLVTSKVFDMLKKLAEDDAEKYARFWDAYARFLKQGVAIEPNEPEQLYPLLRFRVTAEPGKWWSLDDYVAAMKPDQTDIYYLMGDDERSALHSPHLDVVRGYGYPVLLLTDPVDAFVLTRLTRYKDHALVNVANADLKLPEKDASEPAEEATAPATPEAEALPARFKAQLGERVSDVRLTERLSESPARLVDPAGAPNQEMQRIYRMLNKDFEPPKKTLEINPRHPILTRLQAMPEDSPLSALVIEQIYEDALLIEGLHPDPAGMIERIQKLMEAALK